MSKNDVRFLNIFFRKQFHSCIFFETIFKENWQPDCKFIKKEEKRKGMCSFNKLEGKESPE